MHGNALFSVLVFFTFVSRFGLHLGSIFELRRQLWSRPNRFLPGNGCKGVSKGPFALISAPKVLSKRPLGSILATSGLLLVMFGKVWGRFLEGFGAQPSAQKYAVQYAVRCTLYAAYCTPYSVMNYSWRSQRVQVRCTLCAVRCRLYAVQRPAYSVLEPVLTSNSRRVCLTKAWHLDSLSQVGGIGRKATSI